MVSLTQEEADAAICKETGMTLEEVYGLNAYEKRLLMGWKPGPSREDVQKQMEMQARLMGTMAMTRGMNRERMAGRRDGR